MGYIFSYQSLQETRHLPFTAENSSNYLLEIGPLYRITDMFNLKEYMYSNNIFISPQ